MLKVKFWNILSIIKFLYVCDIKGYKFIRNVYVI